MREYDTAFGELNGLDDMIRDLIGSGVGDLDGPEPMAAIEDDKENKNRKNQGKGKSEPVGSDFDIDKNFFKTEFETDSGVDN